MHEENIQSTSEPLFYQKVILEILTFNLRLEFSLKQQNSAIIAPL